MEKKSKLSHIMLSLMKKMQDVDDGYNFKWINVLSKCLSHIGMYNLWLFDGAGFSTEYVKLSVKMRLKDIYL